MNYVVVNASVGSIVLLLWFGFAVFCACQCYGLYKAAMQEGHDPRICIANAAVYAFLGTLFACMVLEAMLRG